MAYARLGLMYGSMGESALSAENASKAYELRNRTSDPERFFIDASYDARVTGNLEKSQQTCEAWALAYPREILPHLFLSGFIYPGFGEYEKSIEEADRAIQLDSDPIVIFTWAGMEKRKRRFRRHPRASWELLNSKFCGMTLHSLKATPRE